MLSWKKVKIAKQHWWSCQNDLIQMKKAAVSTAAFSHVSNINVWCWAGQSRLAIIDCMKKTNVAINGFGRIGRLFFKLALQNDNLQIVGINDLGDLENMAYLLRHDSAQKALNLYLKLLWCLGKVKEPPHCPFDSIVISKLGKKLNWTELDDIQPYKDLVNSARTLAGKLSIAKWELEIYNSRST